MQPASADFLIRRGDSEAPTIALRTEDPATFKRGNLLGQGDIVRWSYIVNGEERVRTSALNGGLVQDSFDLALFSYPFTPSDTLGLSPGIYPYRVHVTRSDGSEITPLVGSFIVR